MEKNNKLIAEFMGADFNDKGMTRICGKFGLERVSALNLKYHTSWDWLMPVVEKIESLKYRVEISHNGCLIESHKDLDTARINSGIGEIEPTKLKATYKAVVGFINQNN
jgi:hypothetical protein